MLKDTRDASVSPHMMGKELEAGRNAYFPGWQCEHAAALKGGF